MKINIELIENLLYGEEGVDLDFKRDQYKFVKARDEEKGELLKDIIAFANSWRRSDAFVLIGVKEIKGGRSEVFGINDKLDDAQIQQFVNGKTQKPITFSYRNLDFEGKCIGIIHIPIQNRPFYLKNDYGKLKKEKVYIKRGSSTDIAELDEVARMGTSAFMTEDKHPILELLFANKHNRFVLPDVQNVFSLVLDTPPKKDIPDYNGDRPRRPEWGYNIDLERPNYDYYTKLVKYTSLNRLLTPINFAVKNTSPVVAKDVRIELKIKDQENTIKALDEYDMPKVPKRSYSTLGQINYQVRNVEISHDLTVKRISDYWLIETGVEKVQPQSTEWIHNCLYIGAIKSVDFAIEVSIYSDNLPEPITKRLLIKISSENRAVDLAGIKELESERFKNSAEYKKFLRMHSEQKE